MTNPHSFETAEEDILFKPETGSPLVEGLSHAIEGQAPEGLKALPLEIVNIVENHVVEPYRVRENRYVTLDFLKHYEGYNLKFKIPAGDVLVFDGDIYFMISKVDAEIDKSDFDNQFPYIYFTLRFKIGNDVKERDVKFFPVDADGEINEHALILHGITGYPDDWDKNKDLSGVYFSEEELYKKAVDAVTRIILNGTETNDPAHK